MERMPPELILETLQHAGAIVSHRVLDALCERVSASRGPRLRRERDPYDPPSAHQELDELLRGALKVKTALVLVCRRWYKIFVPYLYSISYATSAHAAEAILRALEVNSDLRRYIRQIIAIPATLESWTPKSSHAIDSLVSLCPNVVQFILLYRDSSTDEAPLIQRTRRQWNNLRRLTVSSLAWESFVTYVVAIADSSKLQILHIYGVTIQSVDLTEARGFLPPHRDLFSLRELSIINADPQCLDLLRYYRFSRLRSFTFYGEIDDLTELSLAAFLGPDFFSLEYLSLPYSALRIHRVILPSGSYTIRTRLRDIVLTFPFFDDAVGAPKFPRVPLHRVETIRIIGKHEPSGLVLAKGSFHAWVGGLCDKRRMPDLCQIRMDIVLGKIKKEELEIAKLSLRNIETSLRAKRVVLKVLDASGTKFETLSAALDAEILRTVEE